MGHDTADEAANHPAPDGGSGFRTDLAEASAADAAPALANPEAVDQSARSPEERHRTFLAVLINTAVT